VTFSCERRLPLLKNPLIADMFVASMCEARERFGLRLHACVVMPEHVHLLATPSADWPLSRSLLFIKLSVGQRVIRRWRQLEASILERITPPDGPPRFWQKGGGFDRNVRDEAELAKEIRYIHRNPVERGLVDRPELWKWSSVRWWMGIRAGEVACKYPQSSGWEDWKAFL